MIRPVVSVPLNRSSYCVPLKDVSSMAIGGTASRRSEMVPKFSSMLRAVTQMFS